MKTIITKQFEAYHADASNRSVQAIIRPGFYYVGAVYPTDCQNGEQIALVFWSPVTPVFSSFQVFKFDLTTLFNHTSKSSSKHLYGKELVGAVIEVSQITPIKSGYHSYPYSVEWEIIALKAKSSHFSTFSKANYDDENELLLAAQSVINDAKQKESDIILEDSDQHEIIPDSDIIENSFEIDNEEFLEELDQLLYDQQIAMAFDAEENELLQLIWDEQRTDKLEN